MPEIRREQAIAAASGAVRTIQSATWRRRRDKRVNRCPECATQCARHESQWVCPSGCGVVNPYKSLEARKGDIVTMQFTPKIPATGTKNWTPAGGFCFNAATQEEADAIKRNRGLLGVLKMSETGTGDLRAEPRTIPIFDVETIKIEGVTYNVVD